MTSQDIKYALDSLFHFHTYKLHNTYIFDWESDFFGLSTSDYTVEVEIKVSKSDFKADFKKTTVYGRHKKHDILIDNNYKGLRPNKFYFACPECLISIDDIPKEYGLIYIDNYDARIVKLAKFLHKDKLMEKNKFLIQLLKKFYYRNIDLEIALSLRSSDIQFGQRRLYDKEYY